MKTKLRASWFLVSVTVGSVLFASLGGATAPAGRYTVIADGVQDNFTGLVWEGTLATGLMNFTQANDHCTALGPNWRLPGVKELQTLVDRGTSNPSIDTTFFPGTPSEAFWTSSADTTSAWMVTFNVGSMFTETKTVKHRARCVR